MMICVSMVRNKRALSLYLGLIRITVVHVYRPKTRRLMSSACQPDHKVPIQTTRNINLTIANFRLS